MQITINNFPSNCKIVLYTGYDNVLAIAFTEQKIVGVCKDSFDFSLPTPPPDGQDWQRDLFLNPPPSGKERCSYAVIGRKDQAHYIGINHIPIKMKMRTICAKAINSKSFWLQRWFDKLSIWIIEKTLAKYQRIPYPNVLVLFVPYGIEIITNWLHYFKLSEDKRNRLSFFFNVIKAWSSMSLFSPTRISMGFLSRPILSLCSYMCTTTA